MEITNTTTAKAYLALGPRQSLIKIAAEGVEAAGKIAWVQGRGIMASHYEEAARVLRAAIAA